MSDQTPPTETLARTLLIHGKVQGVWYRASARTEAERLGLAGWVRNRRDGTVEVLIAGTEVAIEAFIDWAYQGPPKARVDRIEISAADVPPAPGFSQLPDA